MTRRARLGWLLIARGLRVRGVAGLAPRAVAVLGGALLLAALIALAGMAPEASSQKKRNATTSLFSHSLEGGTPNGPSTNPVISGDRRFAQIVAFESEASNLVSGDTNGLKDVFAVRRSGSFKDDGSSWKRGTTQLVSRGPEGQPADGPSFDPSTDGSTQTRARCVAFLSDATNLVAGDTNAVTDAFVGTAPDFKPTRVSLPDGVQATTPTTKVAVSGDCSRVAFVTGGKLYVRTGSIHDADPHEEQPGRSSVRLGRHEGTGLRHLEGRLPARREEDQAEPAGQESPQPGVHQPAARGQAPSLPRLRDRQERPQPDRLPRARQRRRAHRHRWKGRNGNGDSREPTIFSNGLNVAFVSDASNLPTKTNGERGDKNGLRDAYFWTATQKVSILESVDSDSGPMESGAQNMSTSYNRTYVVFDSSANGLGPPQIYMRYFGGG